MTVSTKTVAQLAVACMVAAILSGIVAGLWEIAQPILTTKDTFGSGPPAQRWGYALLSVIRSVGFFAGLFGLYQIGTNRGRVVTVFMLLAALGAVFFAVVWLYMAATGEVRMVYVLGGLWYQWIAPVAVGIAALRARRVSIWLALWSIVVGIVNSQIFMLFRVSNALLLQGVVWLILGYMIYASTKQSVAPSAASPSF